MKQSKIMVLIILCLLIRAGQAQADFTVDDNINHYAPPVRTFLPNPPQVPQPQIYNTNIPQVPRAPEPIAPPIVPPALIAPPDIYAQPAQTFIPNPPVVAAPMIVPPPITAQPAHTFIPSPPIAQRAREFRP